jgi:hypothetical protein
MAGKRMWKWLIVLMALSPVGCQSMCDRWYPCHPTPAAYAPAACCPPCAPACNPCCVPAGYQPAPVAPAGYPPASGYPGTWSQPVPQTRMSSAPCCE